jgi:hypothetical protein
MRTLHIPVIPAHGSGFAGPSAGSNGDPVIPGLSVSLGWGVPDPGSRSLPLAWPG